MEAACVRSTFVAALTFLVTAALPADGHEIRFDPGESVLRVVAARTHGEESYGSAVMVAPGRLVTNCHVLRDAHSIEVARGENRWRAELQAGDATRDICILAAPHADAPHAVIGSSFATRTGEAVSAIGYPGGGPRIASTGKVEALYRYHGGRVIQTSAPFAAGASGGALFDASGRLIGILTFKARAGGAFHFAIPVDWLASIDAASGKRAANPHGATFYEMERDRRPHFLRAALHQLEQRWSELFRVCEHWAAADPGNDEPMQLVLTTVDRLLAEAPQP